MRFVGSIFLLLSSWDCADAWTTTNKSLKTLSNNNTARRRTTSLALQQNNNNNEQQNNDDEYSIIPHNNNNRRNFLKAATAAASTTMLFPSTSVNALVKGNAPPPRKKASDTTGTLKCTNVDECQALAERKEEELKIEREKNAEPTLITQKGNIRYKDIEIGKEGGGEDSPAMKVEEGNEVTLYFKVLKLGKRSYDGISGEGTVVFSRGYGLEDDEIKDGPGSKSFTTTVGSVQNIIALNYAVLGMNVGGIRRFAILPQKGWEKATKLCDGGPGGSGAGGELKTDYVVVPTATMVSTETCFDKTKIPFPTTYAEERRMAQRFDQALIMEIEVVKINKDNTNALGLS